MGVKVGVLLDPLLPVVLCQEALYLLVLEGRVL